MFNGVSSLPSRYVTTARLTPPEQAAATALASGLARGFDPEIVTFEPGPQLDEAADVSALKTPTVVVSYRVEPSGTAYAMKKPRCIFLGLVLFLTAEFQLPGDANPPRTKLTSTQRVPVNLVQQEMAGAAPGTLEAAVYDTMVRAAFTDLNARYLALYFKDKGGRP
jgi:hypothetical protein